MCNGWIPASVFAPKTTELVLVLIANRDDELADSYGYGLGWYDEEHAWYDEEGACWYGPWEVNGEDFDSEFEVVVAWRPLPNKPSEEVLKEWRSNSIRTSSMR